MTNLSETKINNHDIMMLMGAYKDKLIEHDTILKGLSQQVGVLTWYIEFLTLKISEFVGGLNPAMDTETLQKEFEEFMKIKMKELESMREQSLKEQATIGQPNLNE